MNSFKEQLSKKFNRPISRGNSIKDGHSKGRDQERVKIKFYQDDKKEILDESLFDKKKIDLIKVPASSQMRKFYNEVKNLQMRLNTAVSQEKDREEEFLKLRPLLKMLKFKVTYAQNRLKDMPYEFVDFIHNNIDSINDAKDFDAFALYFEALIGYKGGKK